MWVVWVWGVRHHLFLCRFTHHCSLSHVSLSHVSLSHPSRGLAERCWDKDPDKRPGFREILAECHRFWKEGLDHHVIHRVYDMQAEGEGGAEEGAGEMPGGGEEGGEAADTVG